MRAKEHNEKIGAARKALGLGATPTKVCPGCKLELPREDFGRRKNGHSKSKCRPCRNKDSEKQRRHQEKTPHLAERRKHWNRKATLKRLCGMTVDEYDAAFQSQQGKCAICATHESDTQRRLSADHCHESGKFRGLLCGRCNTGIGMFGDNPEFLQSAIKYLTRRKQ